MVELSTAEAEQIIAHTGMDLVLMLPEWQVVPVVFYSRDESGLANFVTLTRKETISSPVYLEGK